MTSLTCALTNNLVIGEEALTNKVLSLLFFRLREKVSTMAKKDEEGGEKKLPYPKSVFFIISTEFCERFSFYGMKSKFPRKVD